MRMNEILSEKIKARITPRKREKVFQYVWSHPESTTIQISNGLPYYKSVVNILLDLYGRGYITKKGIPPRWTATLETTQDEDRWSDPDDQDVIDAIVGNRF